MTVTTEPSTTEPDTAHQPAVTTAPLEPTPPTQAPIATVIEIAADQIAQHPDNLRNPTRGIRELAASIAEVGVLVPLIVVPTASVTGHDFGHGIAYVAVDGNRRLAAAQQAGLPVPCIVRPDLDSAREHALTMAVTGLARDDLNAHEEAHAVQALLDLGVDTSAIGRATGRTRRQVTTARKAATLTADVTNAVSDYPLTLADLAALAEWQHDPQATAALLAAIPHGQLTHELARLTLARRESKARARAVRELTGQGITVTEIEPSYRGDGPRQLGQLRSPETPVGVAMTADDHAQCPGHVAYVEVTIYAADPNEGTPEETEVTITYGCADPTTYGHADRWTARPIASLDPPRETSPDEEDPEAHAERLARQAQARAEAEAVAAENARQARRELIRLNKEADAAQVVRRDFLRQCLTVKTRHKAMAAFALSQLLGRTWEVTAWLADRQHHQPPMLTDILGDDPVATAVAAPAARQPVMLWAYVAAAHESVFHRDAHRDRSTYRADYLRHLVALSYVPSDVERRVIANVYPEQEPYRLPLATTSPTTRPLTTTAKDTQQETAAA